VNPILNHRLQLAGLLTLGLLILLCLANLAGLFDGKPTCTNDPMFYLQGTAVDCGVGP
jgi:hypothetical protein